MKQCCNFEKCLYHTISDVRIIHRPYISKSQALVELRITVHIAAINY